MNARAAFAAAAALALGGCEGGWFGGDTEEILPGERVSVLLLERALEADPELGGAAVTLPEPVANAEWPAPWGGPTHVLHHVAAGERPVLRWRRAAGSGEGDENRILSGPVIAGGRAFLLDSRSTAVALDLETGRRVWARGLLPEDEDVDASFGGGVTFADGAVYATTAFGEAAALDAGDGSVLWRRRAGGPFRAAPAVAGGRVFAVSSDNRTVALDAADGRTLWTHEGIAEPAGLLGAATPAASGDLVLTGYSSGEVFALRVENGRVAWSDSPILQGRPGARTSLSDVDASPVIDGDRAFVASQGGSMAALDLRSGLRLWDREVPTAQTPWVAGDHLYAVTVDAELVCLRREDGRVRWVSPLPRYEDPEDREDPIRWAGPLLAGGALFVAGSHGVLLRVSPQDGETLDSIAVAGGTRAAPIAAGGAIYLLTGDADLVALR